ncbi:MAG: c-type cytochrome [Proteobacteria bacterium]|nr:c-type cytochrome [Pseudomonadota bacterium]MBU1687247.1 c-type cytochrome [Pseudomonadota bacterium]
MKNILPVLVMIISGTIITSCITTESSQERALGKNLFKVHCVPCHGQDARGQDPLNPNGGSTAQGKRLAPALNGTAHSWHHPPTLLLHYIQEGSIDKSSPMPSFGDTLSKKESLAIITYIQSLWPEEIRRKYRERFAK